MSLWIALALAPTQLPTQPQTFFAVPTLSEAAQPICPYLILSNQLVTGKYPWQDVI